jgi:bifunctional DNA-binding transcriptional regulator/antitoxin component of YhaV-PrlF toxin-antitoxin module
MRLIAVSPIGKNGQTVVPASVRRMFRVSEGRRLVGFYEDHGHVEIAPVTIEKADVDYTSADIDALARLARRRGGKKFRSASSAKNALKGL